MPGFLKRWLSNPAALGGTLLLAFTALAIILENTALRDAYRAALSYELGWDLPFLHLRKTLEHWISDGLMVIFFVGVGIEIKKELAEGRLSTRAQAMLPALAALGGMCGPALIFAWLNYGTPAIRGWAIPSATDIAFSLAVLRLVGKGVPDSLRIFLTALAVLDDFGAIVIIALFYTSALTLAPLFVAAGALLAIVLLGRRGVKSMIPYVLCGIVLWLAILASGVHATIAGVLFAFAMPLNVKGADDRRLVSRIETGIAPWVALAILPLFALANAGVSLGGLSTDQIFHPVTLGIALGLFFGKQIGVFVTSFVSIKIGLCAMPSGARWSHFYGVAVLTGIGFTMSLFTAALAFPDPEMAPFCRLGVMAGSIASTIFGGLVLWWLRRNAPSTDSDAVTET